MRTNLVDFGLSRVGSEYHKETTETSAVPYRWAGCLFGSDSLLNFADSTRSIDFGCLQFSGIVDAINLMLFDKQSDVWAFGVVLFELFSYGGVPYSTLSNSEVARQVPQGAVTLVPLESMPPQVCH